VVYVRAPGIGGVGRAWGVRHRCVGLVVVGLLGGAEGGEVGCYEGGLLV
jgi:hypothetical protein